MKVRLLNKFSVFQVVPFTFAGRGYTMVNLELDGRRYYSVQIAGNQSPFPGEKVAVAFRDEQENHILGWVDPISKKFFHTHYGKENESVLNFV